MSTGPFTTGVWSVSLDADYYQSLFSGATGGIHVFPSYEFRKDTDAALNLGIGYVLSAIDAAKSTSRLNAELFVATLDVRNARGSEKDFRDRTTVGLRLALPFNLTTGG